MSELDRRRSVVESCLGWSAPASGRANVSYAVMLGLVLTAVLGGLAMFTDTNKPLASFATAIVVFIAAQMFLTISMILKRIRSLYRAFRQTDIENIP